MTAEWASVYAETASAAGTFCAVIVALWLALAEARRKREAEERQQAEQISAWLEELSADEQLIQQPLMIRLVVQNASTQLAYNLIASIVSAQSGQHVGQNDDFRNYLGRIAPGKTSWTVEHPGHGMHKRFAIELAFEDSGGRVWLRTAKGKLVEIKGDPLAHYKIDPPVAWLMP